MPKDNEVKACDLRSKKCLPCTASTPRFSDEQSREMREKSTPKWQLSRNAENGVPCLVREIAFKNFVEAIGFINLTAVIAEQENHHPDIALCKYRHVHFRISTHAIRGLSENDFILAAKIDELLEEFGL